MGIQQDHVERAKALLDGIVESEIRFYNQGISDHAEPALLVGECLADDLTLTKLSVYLFWDAKTGQYNLMVENQSSEMEELGRECFASVMWRYPLHRVESEAEVRARLRDVAGLYLLLNKKPELLVDWPNGVQDSAFEQYQKEWRAEDIPHPKMNPQDLISRTKPGVKVTKSEEHIHQERSLITGDRLVAALSNVNIALNFNTEFLFDREGTFGHLLRLMETPGVGWRDLISHTEIQFWLATLIRPDLDPKWAFLGSIEDGVVDEWVEFLDNQRLPVWIWEWRAYLSILDTLRELGLRPKVTEGDDKEAEMLRLIHLKKRSLHYKELIPLEEFEVVDEKVVLEDAAEWLQIPSLDAPATARQYEQLQRDLNEDGTEDAKVQDAMRAFEIEGERLLRSPEHFGRADSLRRLSDAAATIGYFEGVKSQRRKIQIALSSQLGDLMITSSATEEVFQRPTMAMINSGGHEDLPGNPFWVLRALQMGYSSEWVKEKLKALSWEMFEPDMVTIQEIDGKATMGGT